MTSYTVGLDKVIEKLELENCTPEIDISQIMITHPDVNRPALQLAGFFDYFDNWSYLWNDQNQYDNS